MGDQRLVVIVTDLKNMADRQEWKGQRFKKIYVKKITQHEEKFFQLSFKGMVRFDLNMEHDKVYGKFLLTVCICSILYFFADCKKIDSASLFTRGIIKNIILSCFMEMERANCFHEYL